MALIAPDVLLVTDDAWEQDLIFDQPRLQRRMAIYKQHHGGEPPSRTSMLYIMYTGLVGEA